MADGTLGYDRAMPMRHFVQVVGFQVPVGAAFAREELVVMLDRVPNEEWRAVFQLCVEELPPELLRVPPRIVGTELHVSLAQPPRRSLTTDIRAFVDRVNRMTFLREGAAARPGAPR